MLTRRTSGALCLSFAAVLLASTFGCGEARKSTSREETTVCTSCHGQPPATGAHLTHVLGGALGVAVACSECHVVPSTVLAPGHFDVPVTVTFGPLAKSGGGLSPSYDRATQTCSNVYCHGNFPRSKASSPPVAPTWGGGSAAAQCGSCHDLPPPPPTHIVPGIPGCNGPDPSNPAVACHPSSYTPTSVNPDLHIDGKICPPACDP
jgi:predicted CxxxxCH...CXXCH cytochrome family protein